MHRTPKPTKTPAAIGTIQWIEAVNAVQPNLIVTVRVLFFNRKIDFLPEKTNGENRRTDSCRKQTPFRDWHIVVRS